MIFVGIDFSISSPAYCISSDDDCLKWGSLSRTDRTEESLKKNTKKPYYILSEEHPASFSLDFMEKASLPKDYSERERIKIDYFLEIVNRFWDSVYSNISEHGDVYIAMEGLSFASNGNALIDISMATALLREKIVGIYGSSRFYVYSPTSIKKFAIKGNAKKDQLYRSLYESEYSGTNLKNFSRILKDNEAEWITPSGAVNKPIDDIVDATWISLYLRENVKI